MAPARTRGLSGPFGVLSAPLAGSAPTRIRLQQRRLQSAPSSQTQEASGPLRVRSLGCRRPHPSPKETQAWWLGRAGLPGHQRTQFRQPHFAGRGRGQT